MGIEIIPIGGYSEIGRNCTAIKVDDEVVILDMGLHMENYIKYTDSDDIVDLSPRGLIKMDAVPNINVLKELKDKTVAICTSHAHLDHIGAIPFLANEFSCPVYATPFSIEVLKTSINDDKINFKNELIAKPENSTFKVSDNLEIEFINVTHSTPQTVMIAIHTKYGVVLYGNDYKLDKTPTFGEKTNTKRLEELKPKVFIVDCLYSTNYAHTPSEMVAKEKLTEILLDNNISKQSIFVTTFSSHIARLKTIKELGQKIGREVVFLGRSLNKYLASAENADLIKFNDVTQVKYSSKVKKFLSKIDNPEKYLFVVTGHQGEPKATLSKIVFNDFFNFKPDDIVIFSCQIIPVPINYENRRRLETGIKQKQVKIYKDVHASGHASREDQREVFRIVKPEIIIPVHGDNERMLAMKSLAIEEGYTKDKIILLKNNQRVNID